MLNPFLEGEGWGNAECLKPKAELPFIGGLAFFMGKGETMKKIDLKLVAVIVCLTFIVVGIINVSAEPPPGKGKNKKLYPIDIPQTGQTISYGDGDDGELQTGIAWPDPRFTDNEDGTVTDNLTGLMWLKDAECMETNYPEFDPGDEGDDKPGDGIVDWPSALEFVACMNNETCQDCNAGYTDWRLPNIKELHSLIDYGNSDPALPTGHPFIIEAGVGNMYWSSTTLPGIMNTRALLVSFENGDLQRNYKTERFYRFWPVRSGN